MRSHDSETRFMDGPLDAAVLGVLAVLLTANLGTWVAGQLAGTLFAASWPPVNPGQTFGVLARLPHHLADPKKAWPSTARDSLPGPVGMWTAAIITAAVFTAGGAAGIRRYLAGRSHRGFASRRNLTRALSEKAVLARGMTLRPSLANTAYSVTDVGVRLGRASGMPLAISAENSVLLMAAPRQGKTSQVIIPWLHHWPGPALVTSVRTDVLQATAALRATEGRPVAVMAPTGMAAWPDLVRWSPTSGCEAFDKARARADVMVTVGKNSTADSGNAAFFGMTATNLLAGWLHAAELYGRPMDDVLRWALNERVDEPVKLLRDHPRAAPGVAAMLDAAYRSPEGTRSNLWTTVQTAIAPLLAETARATFSPPAGKSFDIEEFLRQRGTIYLLVSDKQAGDLAPLIASFVDEITEQAKRLADKARAGRLDPPLAMFCDEVANVAPLPDLPALMSYSGGTGIFIVAVLQEMAQATLRWGQDGAAMIWGASTVKIALGGLSGDELRKLSELAGEYRETQLSHQWGSSGRTVQSSLADRRTLRPDQVRTLDDRRREALVIHATTPPVIARMQRHYESPDAADYARSMTETTRLMRALDSVPDAESTSSPKGEPAP
ncbi:type IV secretory system conjugative DNA transfer family protein [Actinomadura atramentaria]|uniref:type IV secretory system conjugative DNA transfer family protein n=1 Tax=Actinomadura atramentaria TaxID=1990 RepID=UPI00036B5DE4|nr:type IV secretory system conjugative DNA transfer family protein [Actinomadura atramentaria]